MADSKTNHKDGELERYVDGHKEVDHVDPIYDDGSTAVDISRQVDDNIRPAVAASPNGMVRSPRLPHLKLKGVTDVPC
jgi:hypothetical protein